MVDGRQLYKHSGMGKSQGSRAGYFERTFDWAFARLKLVRGTFGTLTGENGPIKAREQLT